MIVTIIRNDRVLQDNLIIHGASRTTTSRSSVAKRMTQERETERSLRVYINKARQSKYFDFLIQKNIMYIVKIDYLLYIITFSQTITFLKI